MVIVNLLKTKDALEVSALYQELYKYQTHDMTPKLSIKIPRHRIELVSTLGLLVANRVKIHSVSHDFLILSDTRFIHGGLLNCI